jgi:hypothetical protein
MLMKYPVTKDGIDYEVTIEENEYWRDTYNVKLNKIYCIKIFNYNINKRKTIYSRKYEIEAYNKINFIHIAKDIIITYENIIKEKRERKASILNAENNFKNWDGKCE